MYLQSIHRNFTGHILCLNKIRTHSDNMPLYNRLLALTDTSHLHWFVILRFHRFFRISICILISSCNFSHIFLYVLNFLWNFQIMNIICTVLFCSVSSCSVIFSMWRQYSLDFEFIFCQSHMVESLLLQTYRNFNFKYHLWKQSSLILSVSSFSFSVQFIRITWPR